MNTKGIKFLAVLAVLAMAFASFAVFSADSTDAATGDASSPLDDASVKSTVSLSYENMTLTPYMPQVTSIVGSDAAYTIYGVVPTTSAGDGKWSGVYTGFSKTISFGITAGSTVVAADHYYIYQSNSALPDAGNKKVTPIDLSSLDKKTGTNPSFEISVPTSGTITIKLIKSDKASMTVAEAEALTSGYKDFTITFKESPANETEAIAAGFFVEKKVVSGTTTYFKYLSNAVKSVTPSASEPETSPSVTFKLLGNVTDIAGVQTTANTDKFININIDLGGFKYTNNQKDAGASKPINAMYVAGNEVWTISNGTIYANADVSKYTSTSNKVAFSLIKSYGNLTLGAQGKPLTIDISDVTVPENYYSIATWAQTGIITITDYATIDAGNGIAAIATVGNTTGYAAKYTTASGISKTATTIVSEIDINKATVTGQVIASYRDSGNALNTSLATGAVVKLDGTKLDGKIIQNFKFLTNGGEMATWSDGNNKVLTKVTIDALTIESGKSVTISAGTGTPTAYSKAVEVSQDKAITNNGSLIVDGLLVVDSSSAAEKKVGTCGIIGTGITYVDDGGELQLGLVGGVATGSMLTSQDTVIYEGGKLMNGTGSSGFIIVGAYGDMAAFKPTNNPSPSNGEYTKFGYLSVSHASDFSTSGKMLYTIYGDYTVTDNGGARIMGSGTAVHTATILDGSTVTVANAFLVPAGAVLNVNEGSVIALAASGSPGITNNGTINFATLTQVVKITNNGTVNIAGQKEAVADLDKTTPSEKEITDLNADVVVLTGAVESVTVPENIEVVIANPTALNTLIIKSGAEAAMTLTGKQTNEITVKNNDSSATGYGALKVAAGFEGIIEFSYGSVYINGVEITGTITNVEGTVKIEGSLGDDLTIEASKEATILVEEGKSLEIPEGATLKLKGTETAALKMNNDGQITGSGTIDVNYYSQFYTSKPVSVSFSGSGKIIIDDGTENVYLSGTYTSQNSYNATQNVIVDGNLTIMKDAYIIIEGGLEVREGVTITIQEGGFLLVQSPTAYVDIYGTVKSASAGVIPFIPGFTIAADVDGDVNIYGSIVASKTATGGETTVAIYGESMLTGTMTVNNNAVAAFGELTISEQGVLTVNGAISGTLYNESVVNFSGSVDTAMLIYMAADGATVQIDALYNGTLGITDVGMYLGKIDGNKKYVDDSYAYVNKVTFANIGGVTVTEKIGSYTYQGTKVLYNTTSIDGSVSVADKKSATDPLMEVVNGTISASGDLKILQAQVNVRGHSADDTATLSVSGTAFVDNTAYKTDVDVGLDIQANGKLSVSGSLISKEVSISDESRINAVAYSYTENTITYYVYSNLGYAIESGIKDLTVLGDLMVSTSTTVPAGYDIDASGKKVTIGNTMYEGYNEVELIIKDGASLSAGSIVVNGTLAVEVADTGLVCSNITSDVYSSDDVSALYTNIYTALAAADAGDVVKITNKNNIVYIEKNVTIKEGATLLIPASKTLGIVEGYTLTVYGTLQNKGTIAAYTEAYVVDPSGFAETAEAKKYAAISVYGVIESMTDMTYDNYKIPGAYFEYKTLKYITSIANSDDMISIAADDTIDIYGKKLEFGSVEYVGTEAEPVFINIHGAIVSGTIAINAAEINIDNGLSIDATFKGITGSITFVGVKTSAASKIVAAVEDDVALLEITKGVFAKSSVTMEDKNRKTTFDGIVAVDGDAKIVLYKPVVKGTLGLSGAVDISGTTSVSGSLIIDNEAVVNAGSNVTVTGSLVALEATTTGKAAGKMVMDNDNDAAVLYVGGSSSLFDSTKTGKQTTSAEAAVTGDVKANHYVAFPGSTFEGKITEYLKASAEKSFYTDFYVEDILFVTIYDDADIADDARSVIADYAESTTGTGYTAYYWVPADLEDCIFDAWQYKSSGEYKDITATAGNPVKVGKYAEVYASIDYYIYTVTIYTDAGVKSVSIDGVELYNAANNRFVTFEPILAGNHKVTYTLKNGYEGSPVLSTSTGTVLKDNTFGVNGTDIEDLYVNFQLIGTEPIPEPEPEPTPTPEEKSEWTVTTILLCVLVVLIAIMAVIVALRLNRN